VSYGRSAQRPGIELRAPSARRDAMVFQRRRRRRHRLLRDSSNPSLGRARQPCSALGHQSTSARPSRTSRSARPRALLLCGVFGVPQARGPRSSVARGDRAEYPLRLPMSSFSTTTRSISSAVRRSWSPPRAGWPSWSARTRALRAPHGRAQPLAARGCAQRAAPCLANRGCGALGTSLARVPDTLRARGHGGDRAERPSISAMPVLSTASRSASSHARKASTLPRALPMPTEIARLSPIAAPHHSDSVIRRGSVHSLTGLSGSCGVLDTAIERTASVETLQRSGISLHAPTGLIDAL